MAAIALVVGATMAFRGPSAGKEAIQASCPQPRATVIPDEWREEYADEGSAFYDAVLSPEARAAILQPSRVTPAPSFASGSAGLASLREGRVHVKSSAPEQEIGAVDWGTTSEGPYYSTQLHGFVGIGTALSASQLTDEMERKVAAFIKDWAVCNIPRPGLNDRAWYEGTVIKRLSNLLVALNYMKRHGSIAGLSYDELIYLIVEQKNYLSETEGVYTFGNHGIRQDMALAATAIALPELPDSDDLIQLAERRLGEASEELFTREGIWVEHAPGYVNYALRLMLDIKNLADLDPRFNPEAFLSRLPASLDYLLSSLTPDLQIPWVGNSPAEALKSEVKRYAEMTLGKGVREYVEGLAGTALLYPDYGHAIVREEDGFYLLFHAAQNLPAIKRHEDALSFILLNKGRVWITEGGLAGFDGNEHTDMMSYLWSPHAHNTYVYGDEYIKALASPDLDAYMRGMTVKGDNVSFEAFSERFPTGVFVTRRLTVDRTTHDIAIHDVLSVPEPDGTCFHGSLHFAPDLQIQVDPATSTVIASDSGLGSLTVAIVSEHLSGIQRFSGQRDPIRGWGTVGEAFGPVQTVVYDICGTGPVDLSLRWSGIS
jgi:hypothetical protein